MNSNFINYEQAHSLVESNSHLFWDGWTIVEWRYNKDGFYKKNGSFRNGKWGTERRYEPVENGWGVPRKYVDK